MKKVQNFGCADGRCDGCRSHVLWLCPVEYQPCPPGHGIGQRQGWDVGISKAEVTSFSTGAAVDADPVTVAPTGMPWCIR